MGIAIILIVILGLGLLYFLAWSLVMGWAVISAIFNPKKLRAEQEAKGRAAIAAAQAKEDAEVERQVRIQQKVAERLADL